jgi:hypothetical protein
MYCARHMVSPRGKGEVRWAGSHLGLRCVKGPPKPGNS